jgi:hypothetical protein
MFEIFFQDMDRGQVLQCFLWWVFARFFDKCLVRYLVYAIIWFLPNTQSHFKVPGSLDWKPTETKGY